MIRVIVFYLFLFSILSGSACKDKQTSSQDVASKQTNTSETSTEEDDSEGKVILAFGNSLTAGYGLDEAESWTALLQQRLDSLGYDHKVINAGLSGETTAGGLNRIDWVLRDDIDIFILELGANDMLRGLDVKSTRQNLDEIIDKVRDKHPGIPVILAGMYAPPNMGDDYEQDFNSIYPDLAEKHKARLIPFFLNGVAGIDSLNLADGIHPNARGQRIVLENVWIQLKPLLE